jgi:aspartyl-tRNA(Asn)/glutamyl-tRNA(Gln) amidotransferase subunit B
MRTKEESEDYRYFQDPDLLPLEVTPQWQAEIKATIPELPAERRSRYVAAGTDDVTAGVLGDNDDLAILFDEAVAAGASGRSVGIWLTGEVIAYSRRNEIQVTETPLRAEHLVELTAMVDDGKLSSSAAKEVLIAVLDGEGNPSGISDARDLLQVSDTGAIEAAVDEVLAENPEAVEKIEAGDMKPFGFLVGQVMRQMGGKADPTVVQQLLRERTT